MKTTRFMKVDGKQFILPDSLTDKEIATLGAILLQLRTAQTIYCKNYEDKFTYINEENVIVSLGTCEPFMTEAEGRAARDARNAEIDAAKAAAEAAADVYADNVVLSQ